VGQARQLTWDGCVNVRDLGGMPTEDGRETTFGAVVRADNIGTLTAEGRRELLDYGVTRVIDLRWHHERDEDPRTELDVEVLHLPLFGDHNERREADRRLLERIPDHTECRRVMYLEHLDVYAERFARAISAVASAPNGCVLIHCAAGIDRAGLIAALLLRLAGVSNEDVATDFALSKANWEPTVPAWIAEARDEREQAFRTFLAAMPGEAMLGVMEEVDRRYGGAAGYLRGVGLSEGDLERARARLRT
jgi:protein tyrosine/serine phosphatase